MPELTETMYCSQQICIPPTFPYLLRQYAKAAIRTQPTDLLRWSTAYFRCLALNLPPPVKPRLEYPIPRDHHGMTPGWLKALLYQLGNSLTVTFRTVWDRWMGACLKHETLIEILCLGGFTDVLAIPWFRFIGLCTSHLTDNLTETMILFCEVLTEEPEGGSAMIPLEIFTDVYTFLANINASEAQTLKNLYFTDAALGLYPDVAVEEVEEPPPEIESVGGETSIVSEEGGYEGPFVSEAPTEDLSIAISCPDIAADDFKPEEDELKLLEAESEESLKGEEQQPEEEKQLPPTPAATEVAEGTSIHISEAGDVSEPDKETKEGEEPAVSVDTIQEEREPIISVEGEEKSEIKREKSAQSVKSGEASGTSVKADESAEIKEPEESLMEFQEVSDVMLKSETELKSTTDAGSEEGYYETGIYESADTLVGIDKMPKREEDEYKLDLERIRALQQELAGETDLELEKFKMSLVEPLPRTKSDEEKIARYEEYIRQSLEDAEKAKAGLPAVEEEKPEGEDVFVEAVPGIGAIVSEKLVKAVVKYMQEVAVDQHGMVMPRNVRHYNCPPLQPME